MRTFLYVQGTRVRVRRGAFPMDAALPGRTGVIVERDPYRTGHYGVQLDGESEMRDLIEDELEPLEEGKPLERAGELGPNVGN